MISTEVLVNRFNKARDILENCKNTKQIALLLQKKRIKGFCGSYDNCPLASYYRKALRDKRISVGIGNQITLRITDPSVVVILCVDKSIKEENFVIRFDSGNYPGLVKEKL